MKCPKCNAAVEFFIPLAGGVFINKDGQVCAHQDGELLTYTIISCSNEKCDWEESKDITEETAEQVALEAGLIENPPVVSQALKNTLGSLCEQN